MRRDSIEAILDDCTLNPLAHLDRHGIAAIDAEVCATFARHLVGRTEAVMRRDGMAEAYRRGFDEGYVASTDPEKLEGCGWVRLPMDADGVPINLGDTLEIDRGGSIDIGDVTDIHLQEGKCAVTICFEYDSGATAYPEDFRHYERPTVEGLLRELMHLWNVSDPIRNPGSKSVDELIAEYSAKLRLAGDAE